MFVLKGLYEWKLTNAETGAVEDQGSQWNVISDRFLNFLFTGNASGQASAAYSSMAILLSDTTPIPGVDYRVAGASNGFNILAYGSPIRYNVDFVARSKYCDHNFIPPVSPITIRVIGIQIIESAINNTYAQPNFVSFIELSTPITQNTTQYLYVKYTVFVTFSSGVGYNTSNSRFLEYSMNMNIFANSASRIGSPYSYVSANFGVSEFLPPVDINNMERHVAVKYSSVTADTILSTGTPYGVTFLKDFTVVSITGVVGSIVFNVAESGYLTGITPTYYYYFFNLLGYSQVKSISPSVSRIFVHPAGRESYIFSDPSNPASSQGTITISGAPTNKYTTLGRVRITKTGDATDLVDEIVSYTAVDTGLNTITVSQDIATGDKYRFTTTGILPSPLSVGVDYYIIRIAANTIKIAISYALALAGTPISITTQGTGSHTLIRQNTGEYNLELTPWLNTNWILSQLPMAIDYAGYVMPVELNATIDTYTNYAEGDLVAQNVQTYRTERAVGLSASMLRGAVKKGDFIYSVQQSRKGPINNICRWRFNTIETSQALCQFGSVTTTVESILDAGAKLYICTNEGIYEYIFATPTVAPVFLSITGIIANDILDACLDPVTGYIWTGHSTGLSKINLGTLTATQYLTGTGQALEGLSANDIFVGPGQLEAYNGRVLKGGYSNVSNSQGTYSTAWVMEDGVGYYRVYSTNLCYACSMRKGTNQVVWRDSTRLKVFTVTVRGLNAGTSTETETYTLTDSLVAHQMMANMGQIGDDSFMHLMYNTNAFQLYSVYFKLGSAPIYNTFVSGNTAIPNYYYSHYGTGFGYAMGAIKRTLIDVDGNNNWGCIWHNYLALPPKEAPISYGWDGAGWVRDNPNSRSIPKTLTHVLVNGLTIDFNNATGGATWDQQFVLGDHSNFVHGPSMIKDNLQTLQVNARKYFCESHVVETYATVVPASAPYEITIPETADSNFRDMDTVDFVTEVYEGSTQYAMYDPSGSIYTYSISTDILTVGANIATGTALTLYCLSNVFSTPYPIEMHRIYYAINVSPTTIMVAKSYAEALSNTPLDIISNGSGTQYYKVIAPITNTYRGGGQGIFKFSSADAGKNLTLTYTYTKFTT